MGGRSPEVQLTLAAGGYAVVGSTIITPPSSMYHWTPPTDETFTYDPGKANSLLDAAGYKDVTGDGYRETPQGKPLTLRLYANLTTPDSGVIGKLVVGWFKAVGVRVQLTTMDDGPLVDAVFNYQGQTFEPDYDMYIWYWTGDLDPTNVFVSLLPRNVGAFSLTQWTDPDYTRLYNQFVTEVNTNASVKLSDDMQRIVYDSSPFIVFYYPYSLEAYNTSRWDGWTKVGGNGPAIFAWYNVDSYMKLKPVAASSVSDSSSSWGLIVAVVGAAAVVFVVAMVLLRRRNRRVEE